MVCPRCRQDNPAGAKFCSECGQRLPFACPACGHAAPDGAKFCVECGTALADTAAAAGAASYTPRHLAEKILASRTAVEGERKPVTVLFCDVVSSTALAERLGPEGMHALLSRFFETALGEVHRYEGTINQFLGDGFMALFGAPIAHEDHARRAVLAALALRRAVEAARLGADERDGTPVTLRMGIHTGVVVVGAIGDNLRMDYTAVGDTTHLAARLQQLAAPGAIVVSEATARLVRGYVTLEALGETNVRGVSAPVAVHVVTGLGARRSPLDREGERSLSRFVGRARELSALLDLVREVEAGRGQAVGIVGEPGAGKSRLILELRRELASRDIGYLEGRCLSFGSAIPYAPVLDLVRVACDLADLDPPETTRDKVVAALAALGLEVSTAAPLLLYLLGVKEQTETLGALSPEVIKARTFDVLRQLMTASARSGALVVAVEDLHWIDRTSEEFIASLAASLPGARIMLLGTYRPGYRPPWADRSYATQLSLAPLGPSDSLAVVASVVPATFAETVTSVILDKAEGNPFFLEELARAVSDPGTSRSMTVPDTVHGVLAARIDRLAEAPKRLLQTASILGREFPARLLSALWDGGGLAPHLHELTRQEFVYERAGADERTYVFKHALTQDVAESTVLTARRRELHRRAADALLRLYPGRRDELAPMLAHHYAEAETWTPAAEYATRAAEAASAAYANREALARYDQALTAAERARLPALDRLRLHAARGHVHERLGEFPAACGDLEAALALARDDGRDSACAEMLGALAELWGGHKDYQRGQELAAEAVRAAEVAGDRRVLADALVRDGLMALNLGRTGRSRRALEQALAIFRETADARGYAKTLDVLAMAEGVGGDIARAIEDGREAIARYEALGERMALTSVLSTVGIWLVYGGDVREGEAMLRRAVDAAVAVGTRSQEAFAHMALAQRGLMYGGMTAARHEAETAYRIAREIDHREWMSGALSVLGGIQRECGDVAGARRTHEEMIGIARELGGALWLAGGLAELALDTVALGDLETAGRSAEEAETVAAEAAEFLALAWLARAALALVGERWDDVLGLVRRIRTDARQFRVLVAEASQFEGAALARLGHPAEAEAVLRAGQSEASAIAAQPAHARLGFALADVLDARGRPDEAAAERTAAQAVRARALA